MKKQRWEGSEKRSEEEEEDKRKSQKKEDAGARKGRKAAKHYTSPSDMLRILRVHRGVIGSVLKPCKLNPCFDYVQYSPLRSLSIFNGRVLSRRWMHENICRWIFRKINQTRVIWGQVYLYEAKTWDYCSRTAFANEFGVLIKEFFPCRFKHENIWRWIFGNTVNLNTKT